MHPLTILPARPSWNTLVKLLSGSSFLTLVLLVICLGCSHDDAGTKQPDAAKPKLNIAELKTKAESGDAKSQFDYANALMQPDSGRPDYKNAIEWLRKSATGGCVDAVSMLGELTAGGQGVTRDPKAAAELFKQAAEAGSVSGQYNLGYAYERGSGVPNDENEATKWYLLAAEGGDATAQYDVAQRFDLGLGCTNNPVEAYKWYKIAMGNSQPDAKIKFSILKAKLSSAQMKEGEQRVSDFVPRKR